MKVRHEAWGAWIRVDTPVDTPLGQLTSMLAVDHQTLTELGVQRGPIAKEAPLEVHVSITDQCAAGCEGCYTQATADGAHVPLGDLRRRFEALAAQGVLLVAFGGGEPTTHPELAEIAIAAREAGLAPLVTTSGLLMNAKVLDALSHFSQVNLSYDGAGETYKAVRGFSASHTVEESIKTLTGRGVRVGVNTVLTRHSFDHMEQTAERVFGLGASEIQWLRYKPAGRAKTLDYLAKRCTPEQVLAFPDTLQRLVHRYSPAHQFRIDCALVPYLSLSPHITAERLREFGVFGCEAGRHLSGLSSRGFFRPCSFLPETQEAFDRETRDPALHAFGNRSPQGACVTCPIQQTCRGGCAVVASYFDSTNDPECPRVRANLHER